MQYVSMKDAKAKLILANALFNRDDVMTGKYGR